jgi:Protein of unknown function (DUF1566)
VARESAAEAGVDAAPDGPITDLNWAQWPMPNAPLQAGDPNPENYTAGVAQLAGTVSDGNTSLMWQVTPMDDAGAPFPAVTQPRALAACESLDFAGFTDWRLPTLIELESIVNYAASPAIDSAFFPSTPDLSAGFWSSSPDVASTNVWDIFFFYGNAGTNSPTLIANYYRCVRGGTPPPYGPQPAPVGRYTVSDGTVYDVKTALTWQETPSPAMDWSAASSYCASWSPDAGDDGGTSWRLPTISELLTLVDFSSTNLIDLSVFPATSGDPFWSSTPVLGTSNRWYLLDGFTYYDGAQTTNYVRCVH